MYTAHAEGMPAPSFGRARPWPAAASKRFAEPSPPVAPRSGRGGTTLSQQLPQQGRPHGLAPDLRQDIGSARWWRGLAALLALAGVAIGCWPGLIPFPVPAPLRMDAVSLDELRSQGIAPLALGGGSGRHMPATARVRALTFAPERAEARAGTTVAPGERLVDTLLRSGLATGDAARVLSLVAGLVDRVEPAPGTPINITLGQRPSPGAPRPLKALSFRARFDLVLAIERRRDGSLALNPMPIAVDTTPMRISGVVGPSLYRSARAAGAPANVVQDFLEQLGRHVDLEEGLRPTDTFDIVVEQRRAATGERQAGRLLYAGTGRDDRPRVQLLRWHDQFYEASGVGEQRSGLVAPVPGRLTSHFGRRRHPILGFVRMHSGLDFAAAHGTPIVAASDGRVNGAGRMGGCGAAVRIDHGEGLETRYCHMSRVAVAPGQAVGRGQVIGYVGSSGLSTGPHLHYEMYRAGRAIDPSQVTFLSRATLQGPDLGRFRQLLALLMRIEPGEALRPLAPGPPSQPVALGREINRLGR